MDQQIRGNQQVFRYKTFSVDKTQALGHGAYGAVYKAKCDQLPCAAKLIHATILDPTDPGADKIMQRFEQECTFLESVRHPNIVQYLGVTRDPESKLPVLLMELLDESLTKMLERSKYPLPYCVQVDICHDIALAVAYLHSNDIIHRDLSSNNVLMIAGRRAKVTDFGMSKLAGATPSMTSLTMCPGTVVYMAPEALREPPRYIEKLDCFSEGVIMIQVCTRLWPEPGPRTKLVPFLESPTGSIEMPVLEVERRKNHIDMIEPSHPLLPIAVDCLTYQESDRASSEELCQRLSALKESTEYRESVQNHRYDIQAKDNKIASLVQQIHEKDSEIQSKADQLEHLNQRLQEKDEQLLQQKMMHQEEKSKLQKEIANQDKELEQLDQQFQDKDQGDQVKVKDDHDTEVLYKDREIQPKADDLERLNQQIKEKDRQLQQQKRKHHKKKKQLQEEVASKERQIRHLHKQLQEKDSHVLSQIQQLQEKDHQPQQHPKVHEEEKGKMQEQHPKVHEGEKDKLQEQLTQQSLKIPVHSAQPPVVTLKWKAEGKASFAMERGASVLDGDMAYFMHCHGEVCSYNSTTKKWNKLPKYPYQFASLAIVNGQLTGIGGCEHTYNKHTYTGKLLCLSERWLIKSWTDTGSYPPMPTKRRSAIAVASKDHLIVAGGSTKADYADNISTVELMDTKTLVWSTVARLPLNYCRASAALCGDNLYILGGQDDKGMTKSVVTCSLSNLLGLKSSPLSSSVWHEVADAPTYYSTCAAVNGELLAVGGCDRDFNTTAAIHKYNAVANSWNLISRMPTARQYCLVAMLPTNELMAVGGVMSVRRCTDKVEFANINR